MLLSREWFAILSVLVLAALLFVPITRMIWVLSVRRLQRRLGRDLDTGEQQGQLHRARFIAIFVALCFSLLFHLGVIFPLYD